MLKKEAKEITGGLSAPSKMPGPAYNLPAQGCITGAKLQAQSVPAVMHLKAVITSAMYDWR